MDSDVTAGWVLPWPSGDRRPLILVGLSTLAQGQEDLMRRCIGAVGGLDEMRALVTLGPALDPGHYEAPVNVRLERFVPHGAVLPLTAAMITQCGLGTVSKALSHGVPMVCIPMLGDQPENAARVTVRGAGLRLSADTAPCRIAAAVRRVVSEPGFRAAAARLGSTIHAEGPPAARAAAEIEAVLTAAEIGSACRSGVSRGRRLP
jgi:MGT family glycosyltransferase